ncbi:MAG: nickel pincer cofactor biosynthesis protein LarB [Planctomycetes bacterium]|nr:nickel pincer cofactor biosynthesis protein LarB [Planctomycetota bacterium]
MTQEDFRKLLKKVWAQKVSVEDALRQVRLEPFEEISCARVDHHRAVRCGFPEVIFCQGKRPEDITEIARTILKRANVLLATRASAEAFEAVRRAHPKAEYHELARCVTVKKKDPEPQPGRILVLCAGTADIPVAEEARVTASMFGCQVGILCDVGVAGIHRLLASMEEIHEADCIVVVAGMEGALPSVVGGLADCPVIAVPTSVGYGASFGGLAPLLTMLNTCAAGVATVNIDNGFGAGYMAAMIARKRARD